MQPPNGYIHDEDGDSSDDSSSMSSDIDEEDEEQGAQSDIVQVGERRRTSLVLFFK